MKYLSLFSGAGGGDIAHQHLHDEPWRCVGYVEWTDYCQKVLSQRQKDGLLQEAPIYGDIRTFINEGFAESYKGLVDCIAAGFPCQPFSVAGKQKGEDDPRNMWPATLQIIQIIKPRYCFLENVPGLLSNRYFGEILCGLHEAGYDAKWCLLGANDVGAMHKRKRLWIVANSKTKHDPAMHDKANRRNTQVQFRGLSFYKEKNKTWKETVYNFEPCFVRGHDGLATRMDRLKALGNGQVPACAVAAWNLLVPKK